MFSPYGRLLEWIDACVREADSAPVARMHGAVGVWYTTAHLYFTIFRQPTSYACYDP